MRIARALIAVAIAVCGCVPPPDEQPIRFDEEPVSLRSEHGLAVARVTLEGDAIVRGENVFLVELTVLGGGAATLTSASGFMPAHGHGTQAVVERPGESYRVRDLLLFMPGRWEVSFALDVAGRADGVAFPVDVP